MSRWGRSMIVGLAVALLTGPASFGILGCGAGSDDTPGWAVRLPDGARYGAWSPDGKLFAIPAHDRVELIGTDGRTERRIDIPGLDNSGLSCECHLGWSKDGAEIHIVTRPWPNARGGIATVDANGGNLRTRDLQMHVSGGAWAPQGWPLILKPRTTDEGRPGTERSQLLRLNGLEAGLDVLLKWRGYISDPAFSPDGSRIAFTVLPESPNGSLWTISRNGGNPQLLLAHLLNPYFSWSPNGHELALTQDRGVFLVSAASGKARLLVTGPLAERRPPAWTPDGRWITYAGEDGSVNKIRRDGTGQQRLFQLPGEEVAGLSWSPDGRHLAYTAKPVPPID